MSALLSPFPVAPALPQREFFGHPQGLAVLFLTEMWERMSYYGMRSLLVLYMVNHLFVEPDKGAKVLGFNALKGALENAFGPLSTQALSSQVYGLYTGFVYLTPLFGGMLADRLLGRRRSIVLGGTVMAVGHFLMAFETMFLPALLLLILGNGCFKPCTTSQVGTLYREDDPRRDRAFTIFYVGVNLGAFLAPLVCGTLGQRVGWHWGFGAAGVGMLLGLLVYITQGGRLPHENLPQVPTGRPAAGAVLYLLGVPAFIVAVIGLLALPGAVGLVVAMAVLAAIAWWMARLPAAERPRVIGLSVACMITTAFWAAYEQQGNTLQIWASQSASWPTVLGFTVPSSWYVAFNPFFIAVLVPLLNRLWDRQSRRGKEPGSLTKMALGCVLLGLGYLVMIVSTMDVFGGASGSLWWLATATFIFTIGEIYLSPVGQSFVTKVAPLRLASMMMGVWYLGAFFGNYLSGWLGAYYGRMSHAQFFALMCAVALGAGAVMALLRQPLKRAMGDG